MILLVVRCANGRVIWVQVQRGQRASVWVCTRDQFQIMSPENATDAVNVLTEIIFHSNSLAGQPAEITQIRL